MQFLHAMECYSAIKKKEILEHAATRMNLGSVRLNDISQTQKDKYCMTHYPSAVRFREAETQMVASRAWEEEGRGSCCLMGQSCHRGW